MLVHLYCALCFCLLVVVLYFKPCQLKHKCWIQTSVKEELARKAIINYTVYIRGIGKFRNKYIYDDGVQLFSSTEYARLLRTHSSALSRNLSHRNIPLRAKRGSALRRKLWTNQTLVSPRIQQRSGACSQIAKKVRNSRETSTLLRKSSLNCSRSFRFLSSNQNIALGLANAPKVATPAGNNACSVKYSWS